MVVWADDNSNEAPRSRVNKRVCLGHPAHKRNEKRAVRTPRSVLLDAAAESRFFVFSVFIDFHLSSSSPDPPIPDLVILFVF